MYYVYVLKSIKSGKLYKGFTDNIERRLDEHCRGKVQTTKVMLPIQLVHVDICETRKEARELEKFFKSGWGREILKDIIN